MCPCFNVKEWWNNVLAEDELVKPIIDEPKEEIIEDNTFSGDESIYPTESGEIVVPGEEKPVQSGDTSRPNPLYFVWEFVKLLFKIILRRK